MWRSLSRIDLWCLGFLMADLVYLLVWEFDYGPYIDWDLVFSGVTPLILLTSLIVVRSRIPVICFIPFLLVSVFISNTYAAMVNGAPLAINAVPTAVPATTTVECATKGLQRTYYVGRELSEAVGSPEIEIPHHEYGPNGVTLPKAHAPVGGKFTGFLVIPEPGRYRFFVIGQRNVRLTISGQTLFQRWINYEWRVSAEREVRFPVAGKYPISLEFYSELHAFPMMLQVESQRYQRRKITFEDLCVE
jgi:hypothetical protein